MDLSPKSKELTLKTKDLSIQGKGQDQRPQFCPLGQPRSKVNIPAYWTTLPSSGSMQDQSLVSLPP